MAPLLPTVFQRLVLGPVRCHRVVSRDGGDQGALNTLVRRQRIFGNSIAIMPSGFNTLQPRTDLVHDAQWSTRPRVLHLSGPRKPWRAASVQSALHEGMARKWMNRCGHTVLDAARAASKMSKSHVR